MARLYVGTYTRREDHVNGHGEGIYCFDVHDETLALKLQHIERGITNPSYLALNSDASCLYAASEITTGHGLLYAYRIENTGSLTLINHQSTGGAAPCYVSVDDTHVLVANYLGGSVTLLPLEHSGGVGAQNRIYRHSGSSVNRKRQEAPHPHAIVLDPQRRFAIVPDLGIDAVRTYQYDPDQGALSHYSSLHTLGGTGPRHLVFAPSGRFAYLMNELDSTIWVCHYADGRLVETQIMATLPDTFTGTPSGADIHIHPSGKFLYASLRDIQCIVRMRVNPHTGLLSGRAYAHAMGTTPRNFCIEPGGRYLIVANQDSDSLVVMAIDPATGLLTPVGSPTPVPSPACVVFA